MVAAMTDQEINEAVAKKLCETPKDLDPLNSDNWDRPYREMIPNYCHSIEAAWEIVKYMESDWRFCLQSISSGHYGAWFFSNHSATELVSEQADTAPMAICLAFLKLP